MQRNDSRANDKHCLSNISISIDISSAFVMSIIAKLTDQWQAMSCIYLRQIAKRLHCLVTFAERRTAWTAVSWTTSRYQCRPLTSRASWKYTRRAYSIPWIPATLMSQHNVHWRSITVRDCTSISSVASTPWGASVDNFNSLTAAMATIRLHRADIPAITTR